MFQTITTKTKILIPMFLLAIILLFISTIVIYLNYLRINTFESLHQKILFSEKVSDALHSLQKERGLSCAFVVNQDEVFQKELDKQRKRTNKQISILLNNLNAISSQKFQQKTKKLLTKIAQLDDVRTEIDQYHITYNGIIKYYSNINNTLLDILVNISKESHIPLITQNILAYTNLLYLKEYMGIERARGVSVYSQQKLEHKALIALTSIFALEKKSASMFLKYASDDIQAQYQKMRESEAFLKTKKMRYTLLYEDLQTTSTTPQEWFNTLTIDLNTLNTLSTLLEKTTLHNIQSEIKELNSFFMILSVLIFSSMSMFVIMLRAFFKLAAEEQRLRIVMDKYIISSTTDLSGKIIDVSEAFCEISGYTKKELIGKPHNIVRHPETPKEVFKTMWNRIKEGSSWSGKVQNRKKNGGSYWVYANVEPLFSANGQIDSYISIRLDITESELLMLKVKEEESKNKLQEEMIREQSRLAQMGEMISMIAHQWRQPLSAISAASASLQLKARRDKLDPETAITLANKIKEFSHHLSATIDDFRNFFKTNKVEKTTSFKHILDDVLNIVEGSLKENNIEIQLEIKDSKEFQTYENELKQVILNLIKNAEDALIENKINKPKIDIIINNKNFCIVDNAGGIPTDIIGKIFDPYFSTKKKKDGTGLGLYMSKLIIEDHCDGKLRVSNTEDGAKFKITLGEKHD
jgi:PAS domain S-box-containing protein